MMKMIALAAVILGWIVVFGLVLILAYLRSRRKSFVDRRLRSRPRLTTAEEPVILPPIAKSRPKGRERGTQRGGVKAA
jgi:hypothetical protein